MEGLHIGVEKKTPSHRSTILPQVVLSVYFPPQNIRLSFLEMGELGGGNSTIFYFHP